MRAVRRALFLLTGISDDPELAQEKGYSLHVITDGSLSLTGAKLVREKQGRILWLIPRRQITDELVRMETGGEIILAHVKNGPWAEVLAKRLNGLQDVTVVRDP